MMIIFFLSSSPPYSSSLLLCLLFLCNSQSAIGISEISEIECLEFGCCIERTRGRGVVISIYYQNLVSVCRKRHVCSARRHRVRNDVDLTSWLSWFSSLLSEQRRAEESREEHNRADESRAEQRRGEQRRADEFRAEESRGEESRGEESSL